jgi:NAD-dependent deacetylase
MRLPDRLYERLAAVRSAGVITGAGVSAESGIATYRGEGGIYDDPAEGDRTVEALSGSTLQSDPDRTWRVVAALARASRGAKPNAAHLAIAEIERKLGSFVLLTQNVDGLHQLAGSKNVIDIHGSVRETVCMRCSAAGTLESLETLEAAPRCPSCDGVLRPNAVLFGELLPEPKLRRIYDEFHADPPDLVLVAGTTALFPYIAEPVFVARGKGRLTVEINPEPTSLSSVVDFSIRARAGEALPEIAGTLGR